MEGEGREVWKDGSEYEGQFYNAMKQGQGTLINVQEQKVYTGAWKSNLKHGIGWETLLLGNTRRKGEWKKGKLFRWLGGTETVSGSVNTKFNKNIDELKQVIEVVQGENEAKVVE